MTGGSNFDKTWVQSSINRAAIERAYEAMQVMGRALPCSVVSVAGSIVTVRFEVQNPPFVLPQVTIPKAESQWIRVPTQPGDYGIAVPAETFMGAVDGLGPSAAATLALQGNLSTLYFLPIAGASFPAGSPVDQNAATIYGANGFVLFDKNNQVLVKGDANGNVSIHGITSFGWDSHGLGWRYTWTGGTTFREDTYGFDGSATITVVNHPLDAPGPIP